MVDGDGYVILYSIVEIGRYMYMYMSLLGRRPCVRQTPREIER